MSEPDFIAMARKFLAVRLDHMNGGVTPLYSISPYSLSVELQHVYRLGLAAGKQEAADMAERVGAYMRGNR